MAYKGTVGDDGEIIPSERRAAVRRLELTAEQLELWEKRSGSPSSIRGSLSSADGSAASNRKGSEKPITFGPITGAMIAEKVCRGFVLIPLAATLLDEGIDRDVAEPPKTGPGGGWAFAGQGDGRRCCRRGALHCQQQQQDGHGEYGLRASSGVLRAHEGLVIHLTMQAPVETDDEVMAAMAAATKEKKAADKQTKAEKVGNEDRDLP